MTDNRHSLILGTAFEPTKVDVVLEFRNNYCIVRIILQMLIDDTIAFISCYEEEYNRVEIMWKPLQYKEAKRRPTIKEIRKDVCKEIYEKRDDPDSIMNLVEEWTGIHCDRKDEEKS